MKPFVPALILIFHAATAMAGDAQFQESTNTTSTQQVVVQAVSNAGAVAYTAAPGVQQAPATVLPGTAAGIGPSSPQNGDYGYSALNDLRQLNF